MANARDVYNVDANKAGLADPQNKQFDLSFPYLSQSHVSVTVNGTATTAFTYATSTRIQLNTGPTAGDVVVIKRATSPNTRLVDYQTGSVLSDEILDKDSLQAFYLAQEANDVADIVLSKNASNLFDAGNERITNVANPTGAQDVATKNYLESTWLSASDKTQLNALNTTNLNTVAGAVSNVNTVAGAITNVNTVAGKNTQIGLLGTSDAVNDMNVLGTAGIVQDLNLLGTTANVAAMATLGTSTNVTNMATLGASGVVANIATVAGVASTMSAAATNATNAASSASAASGSAAASANSAAAAAASFDTFDDRYLGSKSSEPSVDNDGNALVSGSLFFDSAVGSMKVYDGGNWILATSAGAVSLLDYEYTATAGQTTFSGSDNNSATLSYSAGNLIVTLNGIVLDNGSDYTATSGTSIVLASGAALNDHLAVVAFKSFTVADAVPASTGGTFAGNVAVTGNISVTGTVDGRDVAQAIPATLGSAGQVLTVNGGASAAAWASPAGSFASLSDTTVSSSDPAGNTNPASGVGHMWVNTTTGNVYICSSATTNNNIWKNVGVGFGEITTFTATGGTVSTVGSYTLHTFTSSANFVVSSTRSMDFLVIAGGGRGAAGDNNGFGGGGGGGAGGMLVSSGVSVTSATYAVIVGAGGSGTGNNSDGSNSSVLRSGTGSSNVVLTAIGGGGGGRDGGSGGGTFGRPGYSPGSGTSGQGNNGGPSASSAYGSGGGGGGAGAVGATGIAGSNAQGAAGGIGATNSFTGSAVYYAGGGGGSNNGGTSNSGPAVGGAGGNGGGGAGRGSSGNPVAGTANTGGGGGAHPSSMGANGGSGIVIIRYLT